MGTVVMPDFDHYTIQLGFGSDPQDWIQLVYGTNSIQDGVLYNWDTTRFPDGQVTLRLAMFDHSGKSYAGRIHLTIANAPPTATPRPTMTRTPTLIPTPTNTRIPPTATQRPSTPTPTSTSIPPTKTPVPPSPTKAGALTPVIISSPTPTPKP